MISLFIHLPICLSLILFNFSLILISILLDRILPIYDEHTPGFFPSGHFSKIGCQTFRLFDINRIGQDALLSRQSVENNPNFRKVLAKTLDTLECEKHQREILLEVYYPTSLSVLSTSQSEPLFDAFSPASLYIKYIAQVFNLPRLLLSHLRLWQKPTIRNAPIHPERGWPVIIFSPGYYGLRNQCLRLCTEIASHGYIVFALDHPFDAVVTPQRQPHRFNLRHREGYLAYSQELADAGKALGKLNDVESIYALRNAHLQMRVDDVKFVIDYIHEINDNAKFGSQFFHKLDFSHGITVIGHSFGGATAIEAGDQLACVTKVVSLDGWFYPLTRHIQEGKSTAYHHNTQLMCIDSHDSRLYPDEKVNDPKACKNKNAKCQLFAHAGQHCYQLELRKGHGKHHEYHDLSLVSPLIMGLMGGVAKNRYKQPTRILQFLDNIVVAFIKNQYHQISDIIGNFKSEVDWKKNKLE